MAAKPLVNVQIKTEQDIANAFDIAVEESEITRGKFLELLIHRYQNPKTEKVEVSKPADLERITALEHEVFITKQELQLLREAEPAAPQVSENEILFNLSADEMEALEVYRKFYERKGHTLAPDQVLYILIRDQKITR